MVVPDRVGETSGDDAVAAESRHTGAQCKLKRWLWEVTVQRPPGWRNEGHRTSALAARRAADDYWARWCEAAALRPDIERLIAEAEAAERAPARKRRASVSLLHVAGNAGSRRSA